MRRCPGKKADLEYALIDGVESEFIITGQGANQGLENRQTAQKTISPADFFQTMTNYGYCLPVPHRLIIGGKVIICHGDHNKI